MSDLKKNLFLAGQYVLPHNLISRIAGYIAECKWSWFKNWFIQYFIKTYDVNMEEAAQPDPKAYAHFNDFFTRELKPGARDFISTKGSVASPADGCVSQAGNIENGRIFQAKGHYYSTLELLAGSQELAGLFDNGKFATIYLSPRDYHRVHMPVTGTLKEMIYVPGKLFSVSQLTALEVPRLFARNERVIAIFDTEFGPMAMIMVGAMIVASIETVWAGLVTPPKRELRQTNYGHQPRLKKGDEMGRFKLGSTVIMLFGENQVSWIDQLQEGYPVRLGQMLASSDTEK